jgi:hypothetical protein
MIDDKGTGVRGVFMRFSFLLSSNFLIGGTRLGERDTGILWIYLLSGYC